VSAFISARDLAERLDLTKYPRSWRGRCPACDYPGNVFSVREKRPSFRPSLYCANGCTRDQLDDVLKRVVAGWKPEPRYDDDPVAIAQRRATKQEAALRLWSGSGGRGHQPYLRARSLSDLGSSAALRFRGDCYHPEGDKHPAMVALVRNATGASVAVHRTYLTKDRTAKANVEPAKASLGPIWGAAVRLHEVAAELVVGEGIESSASAGVLMSLPAWAANQCRQSGKGPGASFRRPQRGHCGRSRSGRRAGSNRSSPTMALRWPSRTHRPTRWCR
jgi:putative DNA primase/helicase